MPDNERFQEAVTQLVQEIRYKVRYQPAQYCRLIREHGELQAARLLNYRPTSDDSLAIAARGYRELTFEGLICQEEWVPLFTSDELEVAHSRLETFAPPPLVDEGDTQSSELRRIVQSKKENAIALDLDLQVTEDDEVSPEQEKNPEFLDDIAWGEELIAGIGVCEKLLAANGEPDLREDSFSRWAWGIFRQHLQECGDCRTNCTEILRILAAIDGTDEKELVSLFEACSVALRLGEQRARELLSAEWKAAGCERLPSECGTADLAEIKWYNPRKSEFQQRANWLELLEWRAVLLCWHAGKKMRECEASYTSPVPGEDSTLWLKWRQGGKDGRDFVSGLTEKAFRIAVLSRHVASVLPLPWNKLLRVPTDGDLASIPETLEALNVVRIEDWKTVLGLPIKDLDYGALLRLAEIATNATLGLPPSTADQVVISEGIIVSPSQCYREMNRLLDLIEGAINRDEAQQKRVSRLVLERRIPKEIGTAMHTIRIYRNLVEHEDYELSRSERMILVLSWDQITNWANSQGWIPLAKRST